MLSICCSLPFPASTRFRYLHSKPRLKRQFLIYCGQFFAIYQDKFSLVISDFISLLFYEKNMRYFNFTDVDCVYMDVKICIFIGAISRKVNGMHEYIFPIADMQIIVNLHCMSNPAISLLSGFLPVQVLTSTKEFILQHLTYFK